ncbi:ribosome small subunit-dependent GTPase A [Haliangium sp.]|uniref:ribosome small subunit-dependent GTPase A n=1 Tax=Haliangium sp. TaxID=2663208 RepID=UPI003D12CDDC
MSDPSLAALGWSDFFATQHQTLAPPRPAQAQVAQAQVAPAGVAPARVAIEYQDRYYLLGADGPLWAQLSGTLLRQANRERLARPAVGDWVGVQAPADESVDGMATIVHCYQRRTRFVRRSAGRRPGLQIVAANVDTVLVVSTFDQDFQPRRLERYLTTVREGGAAALVVLNKRDLCGDDERVRACLDTARSVAGETSVLAVSAADGSGLDQLRNALRAGETVALVGSSGVGKSTLINRLCGEDRQQTAPVREYDGRGRHTTTHRELIALPGGSLLIDTPGMRELALWTAQDALLETFADIAEAAAGCRFRDCRHRGEPECAVASAVRRGELDRDRLAGYHKLLTELESLPAHRRADAVAATRVALTPPRGRRRPRSARSR